MERYFKLSLRCKEREDAVSVVNVRTVFIYLSVASPIDTSLSRIIYKQSLRLSYNEWNEKKKKKTRVRCIDDCARIACTNFMIT